MISFLTIPASALTIYIDLGNSAGSGAGNWNTLTVANRDIADLIDWDTGLPTGISVETNSFITSLDELDSGGAGGGWDHSTPGNWVSDAAANDSFGNRSRFDLSFANVSKETTYIVEVLSFSRDMTTDPADITVQAAFADRDVLNTGANGDDWQPSSSLNGNWLIWENVVAQGGAGPGLPGELLIHVDDEDDDDGFNAPILINAVRIRSVTIPEPSSALLSVVALTSLLGRRSRISG